MPLVLRVAVVALCNAALSAPKQATARSLMRCKVPQPLPINTQAAGRMWPGCAGLLTHASTDTYVWCKTYQQPTGFRNFTALRAKPRSWQLLQVLQMPFSQHIHLHNPWHNPKPATATAVRHSRTTPHPHVAIQSLCAVSHKCKKPHQPFGRGAFYTIQIL